MSAETGTNSSSTAADIALSRQTNDAFLVGDFSNKNTATPETVRVRPC